MNQPNAPMIAPRVHAPVETPQILSVFRRYALLMAVGTAIGGGVAFGLYQYFKAHFARYQSFVEFQVLAPAAPLGVDNGNPVIFNSDDTSQFIHRQVRYITQDNLLKLYMEGEEFHTPPAGTTLDKSEWLTTAGNNPLKTLKRDLVVTPILDSAAFRISMTAHRPEEAYSLVQAIQKVYQQQLKSDDGDRMKLQLGKIDAVLSDQEKKVRNLTLQLSKFSEDSKIPALTSAHAMDIKALDALNSRALEAAGSAAGLKNSLESMNDQQAKGTLKLSADAMVAVNDDYGLRTLLNLRLSLDQEKVAQIAQNLAPSSPQMRAIDARISKVDEQIDTMRGDLEKRAMARMLEHAASDYAMMDNQAKFYTAAKENEENDIKSLEITLVQWQTYADELKAQTDILDSLRKDERRESLNNGNTDDTRLQLMVGAVQPESDDFVWPSLPLFLTLGLAGGFGLAFGLSYLLAMADKSVRTPHDITRTLQQPLLGFIPDESDDKALTGDVGTALITSPSSMIAESFRQIRSHLVAQTENSPVSTLLVASITPGGGATTVASNLAAGMAMNDRRVLLIDANFYRPNLQMLYNNLPAEGFTDVLSDPELLETAIVPAQHVPKLHLMGAGSQLAKASSEILEGRAFRELLDKLHSKYDLIIFDAAPLNLVADSLTLAARVDGVITVVRAGEVSRGTVSRIREQLRQVHANVLGFILNAAQVSASGYFKENYKSFYRYAGKGSNRPNASISGSSISK